MKLALSNNPLHEFIKETARKVDEKSGGMIGTEFYPAAQLGKIPRLIERPQLGRVEFFGMPSGFLKGVDPRYHALRRRGYSATRRMSTMPIRRFANRPSMSASPDCRGREMYGPTSYAAMKPVRTLADQFRVLAIRSETEIMGKLLSVVAAHAASEHRAFAWTGGYMLRSDP